MTERIEEYTVGELARLAHVTVRMLHHYDDIGLLHPAYVAANGYRLYRRAEAERLQEILLLRAGGVPLAEIAGVLDRGADRTARLEAHRDRMQAEVGRLGKMIETLEQTLSIERKGKIMAIENLYTPPAPETQTEYEIWLEETYGAAMAEAIAVSKAHLEGLPNGLEGDIATLRAIEATLVAAFEAGVLPEQADVSPHRAWVAQMWGKPCSLEAYCGLADVYLSHPDFVARYEALSHGFSQWLPNAMRAASA